MNIKSIKQREEKKNKESDVTPFREDHQKECLEHYAVHQGGKHGGTGQIVQGPRGCKNFPQHQEGGRRSLLGECLMLEE